MKKFKIASLLLVIIMIACFGKTLFAGSLAIGLVPFGIDPNDPTAKPDVAKALTQALIKENPSQLGFMLGNKDNDLFFSNGGAGGFIDEANNQAEMSLRLTNSSATMKRVVLFPGYFNRFGLVTKDVQCPAITTTVIQVNGSPVTVIATLTQHQETVVIGYIMHDVNSFNDYGERVDACIDDATIYSNNGETILCESMSKGNIQQFLNFCLRNPTRIPKMVIYSNNVSQYTRKMTIKKLNPTGDFGEHYIQLQNYFKTDQWRTEKIIVNTNDFNLQFDDQCLIIFELEGRVDAQTPCVTEITMTLGASHNKANGLYRKAVTAKRMLSAAATALPADTSKG